MYSVETTKRFEKDLKRCQKRGLDLQLILDAIALLRKTGTLPAKYRPHKFVGQPSGTVGVPHSAQLVDDLGTE